MRVCLSPFCCAQVGYVHLPLSELDFFQPVCLMCMWMVPHNSKSRSNICPHDEDVYVLNTAVAHAYSSRDLRLA